MGVKGLNKFITKFERGIIDHIDMREEIENWKVNHNGKLPTILIDLKEFMHIFAQRCEIGIIMGGQYDWYNSGLRQFLDNLTKTNVKLVFFMAGNKNTDDLQLFVPRREEDYIFHLDLLDKIEQQINLAEYVENTKHFQLFSNIRMIAPFNHNLKRIVRRYGDLHVNYLHHNQEIALYAREHSDEVLAVITNDTDFLAFEGTFQFWRAFAINKRQLRCSRYCKKKLNERLGLNVYQMQLLSALCGSNYLPIYAITDFINGLVAEDGNPGKILKVSAYVKRQTLEMVKNKPKFDLNKISRDVFGPDFTPVQLNSIANGLTIYDLDFQPEPVEKNAFLNFCKKHDSFMYQLVKDDIFKVKDIDYIDFRNYKSKSYAELTLPLLAKLCGILHKDDRVRPEYRNICMKHAHDEPFKVTEETINYPPNNLPELFDLIFKNKERSFDECRWNLLAWALNFDDDFVKQLKSKRTQKNFKPMCAVILTLQYLIQQEELTTKEANAILSTEFKIRAEQRDRSTQPPIPNSKNVHFVRTAHLYVKIYTLVSHCMDVCGLHDLTDLVRFDGLQFHKMMEKFETATEQQMMILLSSVKSLWTF